jgi:predicted metal-binding protein
MIETAWERVSADALTEGYYFKKIDPPAPDEGTMSECRKLCAENLCGEYGVTWACPPGVGSEEECLNTVRCFSEAAIIVKKFENVDVNDKPLVDRLGAEHQDVCRKTAIELRHEGCRATAFADGGCKHCKKCSYPDSPCKFPDQMVASISSYGIMMDRYMSSQGIEFEFEEGCMTLYGLILYSKP